MNASMQNYDIIVVGAGLAGHCAAMAATQAEASVLLLEKTAYYGGSTAMCGGSFAFAGTDLQARNGINDSYALLEEDLLKAGKYRNSRELVKTYVEHQLDAYNWLRGLGLAFDQVSLSSNQSVPRNHSTNPVIALDTLHALATKSGLMTYRNNTAVKRLITSEVNGVRRVTGVCLDSGEKIMARGGIILTTGGFSRADDLIERFAPESLGAQPMGGEGNSGDGIRMAWALGADMLDMTYVKPTFGAALTQPPANMDDPSPRILAAMYRGAVIVNKLGRRFIDESKSYKAIGAKCMLQPDRIGFQILDSEVMDRSSPLPRNVNFKLTYERGLMQRADSIEELAEKLVIDVREFKETIDRYNAACEGRIEDEFGRSSLSTGYGKPSPIARAPFYGYPCTAGLTSTFCGLAANGKAEVLDIFGEPIKGLYAAGELMGGLHGESYMSGTSLGKGCIFGRIAAADAAAYAKSA